MRTPGESLTLLGRCSWFSYFSYFGLAKIFRRNIYISVIHCPHRRMQSSFTWLVIKPNLCCCCLLLLLFLVVVVVVVAVICCCCCCLLLSFVIVICCCHLLLLLLLFVAVIYCCCCCCHCCLLLLLLLSFVVVVVAVVVCCCHLLSLLLLFCILSSSRGHWEDYLLNILIIQYVTPWSFVIIPTWSCGHSIEYSLLLQRALMFSTDSLTR